MSKKDLFLELAKPDEEGFSRRVSTDEFTGKYACLLFGNGGDWCRDDGALGYKYNVTRHKEKGHIVAVQLYGYKKQPILKPIPTVISKEIKSHRCAVLYTSKPQVDHKDGRLDDPRLTDSTRVTIDDFQPLSQAANVAKREHCKKCRATDKRFDAKVLGYPVSQIKGNGEYRGSCIGCYWHSPKRFNQAMSFKP